MRVSLLVCIVAIVFVAGSAHAEGRIGLYRDVDMASCAFADESASILSVHVVQTGASAGASEFMLQPREGASLIYLAESIPTTLAGAMGRADVGVAVAYGGCVEPPIHVLTVLYQGFGLSGTCGEIAILNSPESQHQLVDHVAYATNICANGGSGISWAEAGHAVVNPDDDCQCGSDPRDDDIPTPVETATWGKVKALYVN